MTETIHSSDEFEASTISTSKVDWDYWQRIPFLQNLEIALLTLGIDPDSFSEIDLDNIYLPDSTKYKIKRRVRLVDRAIRSKILASKRPFKPKFSDVLSWITTYDIECHPEFISQSKKISGIKNYRTLYRKYKAASGDIIKAQEEFPKNAHKKIKTVNEIIYAVAWGVFGFGPNNNAASKSIHELLTQAGFKMTEQSVRNSLNAAHNYLDANNQLPEHPHKFVYGTPRKRTDD